LSIECLIRGVVREGGPEGRRVLSQEWNGDGKCWTVIQRYHVCKVPALS